MEEKDYEYYFVINANIDKWVHSKEKSCDEKYDKRLCTEKDIVCLKKAFYDNLLHQICCGTIDSKTIKDWARKKIEKIEGVPERDIVFDYSLVNITCEAIDTSNLQQLEDNFAAKYFEFPHQKMENNIDGNYKQFIYGVLFGNDDYIRVPEQKINRVIDKSYTNNDTEMTYARRRSIVFLKTHSPFERYPPFPKPHYHLEDNLDNVQNIYDICSALYIETQMRKLRNPNEKRVLVI